MKLELSPLANAIARLDEGWAAYDRDRSQTLIRDGLIQRFEFTYEISHKILKRYLEKSSPNPEEYDSISFQDLIRTANERGLLLGDWSRWKLYREMRSRTSHTYHEDIALEVVKGIPAFLAEARYLCDQMMLRQD